MERNKRIIVLAVLLLIVVLVGWVGYGLFQNSNFRLTKTVPALSQVPAEIPEIDFVYNRDLSSQALAVSSAPNIITSTKINGKTLIVNLSQLTSGQTYEIKIFNIESQSGEKITNKSYRFTAKTVAIQDQPADVRQLILNNQQTKGIYSFNFTNFKALTDHGLPAANFSAVENFIYAYAQKLVPPATSAVLDSASVTRPPRDPNNPPTVFSISFNVAIGGNLEKAQVTYTNDSDTHLVMYDSKTGALVYDSVNNSGQ